MKRVISVSTGELALKGSNKKHFENSLIGRMKKAMGDIKYDKIYTDQGKIYIETPEVNIKEIIQRLKKVFGLIYISPCIRVEKNMEEIHKASIEIMKEKLLEAPIKTFKVVANRVDKNFKPKSPEICKKIGSDILDEFEELSVDVHNPETYLYIDIKGKAYVYTDRISGYGGMPVGTGGKGLLLLSGGIDSSVAGFLMAKRGLDISGVHFHSYPFTSERSEEKVKTLSKILSPYTGKITLYSVNILEIQKELNSKCPEKEMTILSRRFMMKIAEQIAIKNNIDAIITGESLGQVASQTIDGITVTNASIDKLVLRPLIGMDKGEIINIARDIGTYETSILPYEDCCTLFLPKHPVIKPRLRDIERSENNVDVNRLIKSAIDNMKISHIE